MGSADNFSFSERPVNSTAQAADLYLVMAFHIKEGHDSEQFSHLIECLKKSLVPITVLAPLQECSTLLLLVVPAFLYNFLKGCNQCGMINNTLSFIPCFPPLMSFAQNSLNRYVLACVMVAIRPEDQTILC